MSLKRIMTAILVVVMISSGLVITTVGVESKDVDVQSTSAPIDVVPKSPSGVVRCVLMEDVTGWHCHPCAEFAPIMEASIYDKGLGNIAPIWYHSWWPAPPDDPLYLYNAAHDGEIFTRIGYFNNFASPDVWIDGVNTLIDDSWTTPEINDYFTERLAIPANMTIESWGDIVGLNGDVTINITAVMPILPTDLILHVGLWENNISRTLNGDAPPYPNGEDYLTFGMWDMLTDNYGVEISLTDPGDFVNLSFPFTIEPDWVADEVGLTIWVQSNSTKLVEQAHVETFDPIFTPANDMTVLSRFTDPYIGANTTAYINGTLYNLGTSNQTNIQVKLLVDGFVEDTQIISYLDSGQAEHISFAWAVPWIDGDHSIGMEVTPVGGETLIDNNDWSKVVPIKKDPDIWADKNSFDFNLVKGQIGFDNLTIGNDGVGDLNYTVNIGHLTEEFGEWIDDTSGGLRDRGNVYHVNTSTILQETMFRLDPVTTTEIYFFVYEGNSLTGAYYKIDETCTISTGTDLDWYSSGPMNTPLTAGKYYYIGASWGGNALCAQSLESVPIQTWFGTLETGQKWNKAGFPPGPALTQSLTGISPYCQKIVTGTPADWLLASPDNGTIPVPDQTTIALTADGSKSGVYQTNIYIPSNDPDETVIIPVNLTVVSQENDISVLDMSAEGTHKAGEPLWINGTISNMYSAEETNVDVRLLVDLGVEDSTIIPSVLNFADETVSFIWTPVLGGQYSVSLYAVPVSGEIFIDDNWWNETVGVTGPSDIWIDPTSFDFVVAAGETDSRTLTIRNDGIGDLDWKHNSNDINLDSSYVIDWAKAAFSGLKYKDDQFVENTAYRSLMKWDISSIPDGASITQATLTTNLFYFGVPSINNILLNWISDDSWSFSGTSGTDLHNWPVDTNIAYDSPAVGGTWFSNDVTSLLQDELDNPTNGIFSLKWHHNSGSAQVRWFSPYGPYKPWLNITYTFDDANWLSVSPDNGAITPLNQMDVTITVNATALGTGTYQTNITVISNDPDEPVISVPVNLSVIIGAAYDIPVSVPGGPWPAWRFVSFPYAMSGAVDVILDDSINGDGLTDWDMVQWYDAQTQEWKSYAVFKPPSLNNLPIMDHTMGVWVHITSSGGDDEITTGLIGAYSGTTININLYTGWNLIGYPTVTFRLASDTLPAQADMVAVYDTGQPYSIRDETVLTGVTMQEGNAYWVHVTADCTWSVDP